MLFLKKHLMNEVKILLPESEIPTHWYNIQADMPNKPLPPLHPGTKQPVGPQDLAPLFPMELIKQEVSQEPFIEIPDEVRDIYRQWRPSPLFRARRLEKALDTPAKIYYKYEGVSPSGSHKTNTAVAQAYYNKQEGVKKITTETGAGQWGTALSIACQMFGIECDVYMVRISFNQKPYRKALMNAFGATVYSSPTNRTQAGRNILASDPDTAGSLGIAISEAIEMAVQDEHTKYALGSVLNHVLTHQTIIGQECLKQMEMAGDFPDIIIAPLGGGSNFAGISFPFVADKINGADIDIIPVEPSSCPTMTRAPFGYDHGDTAQMTPLLAMHSLGHNFVPAPIHAGGLRYHGVAPLISHVIRQKLATPRSIDQLECYAAAVQWARTEGFIPAPETSHAIAAAIQEAKKAKEEGKEKVILFNWSGHGLLDLIGYDKYFNGQLTNYSLPQEEIDAATEIMKKYPKPA